MILGPFDITTLGTSLATIDGLKEGFVETDGCNVPTNVGDEVGWREGNTDTLGSTLGTFEGLDD